MLKVALDIGDPIVDKIMYDVVGMDEDVSIVVWPWLLRVLCESDVQCRRIQVSDPHNGKRVVDT
jgi:hypothetical protein